MYSAKISTFTVCLIVVDKSNIQKLTLEIQPLRLLILNCSIFTKSVFFYISYTIYLLG